MLKMIYRPTVLTLLGAAVTLSAISGTTGYILGRATSLPPVLAVSFDNDGIANRFVRTSYPIVFVPVWIQLTLTIVFGTIVGLLLHRSQKTRSSVEDEVNRQERERILMTAEAVALLAAIWVTLQGLLAIRLIIMWQRVCCGLGGIYYQSLLVCIILSIVVGIRAAIYVQHPKPVVRSTDDAHWRLWGIYFNRQNPALFVPMRTGIGWTVNFGRPQAVLFVVLLAVFSVWAPLVIIRVLVGE